MAGEKEVPGIIAGGSAIDDRGVLSFVNEFSLEKIKRFYVVENFSTETIRAFHGHLKEEKYVFVVKGTALVICAKLDKSGKLEKGQELSKFVLSDRRPAVLRIPGGYVNGFKPLEDKSKIMFFSTASLDESKGDDYRFDWNYFGKNVWEAKNR